MKVVVLSAISLQSISNVFFDTQMVNQAYYEVSLSWQTFCEYHEIYSWAKQGTKLNGKEKVKQILVWKYMFHTKN